MKTDPTGQFVPIVVVFGSFAINAGLSALSTAMDECATTEDIVTNAFFSGAVGALTGGAGR